MERKPRLAPLEDACTVVLLRDGGAGLETLMLERPHSSRSFAGAWVFPGGKVDAADRLDPDGTPLDDFAAAQAAGLRELAEETGQLLSEGELAWLSQWTPMQDIPRRFRTWFMLARAGSEAVVRNPEEHVRHAWLTPARALEMHGLGEMLLVPPTWVTLHNLAEMESTAHALAASRAAEPFTYQTHLLDGSGVIWAGDEAYPDPAQAGVNGARHRLTMAGLPWIYEKNGA